MGPGIVPATAFFARGTGGGASRHFRQHRSESGAPTDSYRIQLSIQDRMHVSRNEASHWSIRLLLLEHGDAKAKPLSPEKRTGPLGGRDE